VTSDESGLLRAPAHCSRLYTVDDLPCLSRALLPPWPALAPSRLLSSLARPSTPSRICSSSTSLSHALSGSTTIFVHAVSFTPFATFTSMSRRYVFHLLCLRAIAALGPMHFLQTESGLQIELVRSTTGMFSFVRSPSGMLTGYGVHYPRHTDDFSVLVTLFYSTRVLPSLVSPLHNMQNGVGLSSNSCP